MNTIKDYIIEQFAQKKLSREKARQMLEELEELGKTEMADKDIAIIGISGKFPKAKDIKQLWENIINGRNCIDRMPEKRIRHVESFIDDKAILQKAGGFLDEIDMFAPEVYGMTDSEATALDPVQRNFLEAVWKSIEDAGMSIADIKNTRTGVFVGRDHTYSVNYQKKFGIKRLEYEAGSWSGILASRVSYLLNLRGPAIVVDTACSSSMVSIYTACQELRNKKCDMAIAGGVSIDLIPVYSEVLEDFVENAGAEVRTFDKKAQGTVWSEGVGAVLLKPLGKAVEDRDNIYAVIKGIAINNDGQSNGILSPNSEAQEDVIVNCWTDAGVNPEEISYIEAHGTGTKLGDPIEIKGLSAAFRKYTDKKQFCAIGAVKTNIGHTQAASGIASLIKVILSIKNQVIPPSINFDEVNPLIKFCGSPVYVNDRLREWKTNGELRTAGISSFGFSGTNCHMVLQEFLPEIRNTTETHGLAQVFTLSALDEQTLIKLLREYSEYTSKYNDFDLADFCFTVNTGRTHFSYRLAIIAANTDELVYKLNKLSNWNGGPIGEEQVYYGSNLSSEDNINSYLEKPEAALKRCAGKMSKAYGDARRMEALQEICKLYVNGYDIDWQGLYSESPARKMSLPGYPARKKSLWPETDSTGKPGITHRSGEDIHPLVHTCALQTLNQKIFLSNVSAKTSWPLLEHKVTGNFTMPGTAYIDMIMEITRKYYKVNNFEVNLKFFYPLMTTKITENSEIHILTKQEKEYILFNIASRQVNRNSEDVWTEHARGKVYKTPAPSEVKQYDVSALMKRLYKLKDFEGMSEKPDQFEFGPRWSSLKQINYLGEEFLIRIQLSEEFRKDMGQYFLHPALMDIAANTAARMDDSIKELYLPAGYKKIRVYKAMPQMFYCYVNSKKVTAEKKDTITYDFCLMDENGNVFAEVEEYSIKKVRDDENIFKISGKKKPGNSFYQTVWRRLERGDQESVGPGGIILIFKDNKGPGGAICQTLRDEGRKVIEVSLSDEFEKTGIDKFTVGKSQRDYDRLIEEICIEKVALIVHLFTLDFCRHEECITQLGESLDTGVYSLFYLTKSVLKSKEDNNINIVLISRYANEVTKTEGIIYPCNAAFFGLGKILSEEYPRLQCRCIDIDQGTTAEEILYELRLNRPEYQLAFRDKSKYTEVLEEFIINDYVEKPVKIRSEGVYVITGGAGGIGLEVAKYLAHKNRTNIVLINRSVLPLHDKWNEIIKEGDNEKLCRKLIKIIEIESLGSNVQLISADISDMDQMQKVFNSLRKKFGKINGIVHSAGVAGDGFLVRKNEEKVQKVLKPKIFGTWVLHKLTEHENLDFFVMFSSLIGVFGMVGSGDYAAANSYLDAFSVHRSHLGKRTLSIDWPAWSETGMAHDFGTANENTWVFKSINTDDAVNCFDKLLNSSIPRALTGEINYRYLQDKLINLPVAIPDELLAGYSKDDVAYQDDKEGKQLRTIYEDARDELEAKVQGIWLEALGNELGIDRIGVNDDYFSIGGNSIIAVKLEVAMEDNGMCVDSSDIYKYRTIRKLSEYIREKANSEAYDYEIEGEVYAD